jgi:hypothetical protein
MTDALPRTFAALVATATLLLPTAAALLPPTAHAAEGEPAGTPAIDADHAAAAEEVLRIIGIDESLAPMAERMRETTLMQLAAMDVAEGEEEIARPYLERIGAIISETLAWENLKGDFVDAYASTFDEAELRDLAEFFRSPVGAKYLDNVSALNRLATEIVRDNAMAAAPRIREITQEMQSALPSEPASGPDASP